MTDVPSGAFEPEFVATTVDGAEVALHLGVLRRKGELVLRAECCA